MVTRRKVAGQSRRIRPEHLMINDAINTVVASKRSRAQNFLDKIQLDRHIMSQNQNPDFARDFVDVIELSSHSKLHNDYNYLDCVINFAYPLLKNQYAIYRENGRAVGYLSWAWFNPDTERDFFDIEKVVDDPAVVHSGTIGWIIDVIAPFGHARPTMRHATEIAHSRGIDPVQLKFQRNYVDGRSRRNVWTYR